MRVGAVLKRSGEAEKKAEETVAIGGGVSAQPRFIQEIQQALDREWKSYWVRITRVPKPEIKVASAGNDANLIGALIHCQAMEQGLK